MGRGKVSDYFYSFHVLVAETVWADHTYACGVLRAVANEENT